MHLSASYRQFRDKLDAQKRLHPPRDWTWYPYRSMENIPVVDRLLAVAGFSFAELLERGPVLDIGCADGDLTYFLESAGAQVDAVDYAPTNFNGMLPPAAIQVSISRWSAISHMGFRDREDLSARHPGFRSAAPRDSQRHY